MKTKFLILLGLLGLATAHAQNNITAFYEYQIKNGMRSQFINGYAQDLEWHKSQGDDWAWIGWFVANGERRGRFIDATPNHDWADFDNWKVDAAENSRKNKIHWAPYVKNSSGSYKKLLGEFSLNPKNWFNSKYLQVYHFELKPGTEAVFWDFLKAFKSTLSEKTKGNPAVWMKTVSGGKLSYYLFIGLDKIAGLEVCTDLFIFQNTKMRESFSQAVKKIKSELWRRSDNLSYIPE
jgi:hypothetical protein